MTLWRLGSLAAAGPSDLVPLFGPALQTGIVSVWNGPGSAVHRFTLHRVRDTERHRS